jgi:hypothetical protein
VPGAAVIAVCSYGDGWQLNQVKIYPVTVRLKPRSQSGFPMLADDETGRHIIDLLTELSAPYGTKIEFKDGVGFVKL